MPKPPKIISTFLLSIIFLDLLPLATPVFASTTNSTRSPQKTTEILDDLSQFLQTDSDYLFSSFPTPNQLAAVDTSDRRAGQAKNDYKPRPKTIFERLSDKKTVNVSTNFKDWALEKIQPLDEKLYSLSNQTMVKVDTSAETKELLAINQEILAIVTPEYQKLKSQEKLIPDNSADNFIPGENNPAAVSFKHFYHQILSLITPTHVFSQSSTTQTNTLNYNDLAYATALYNFYTYQQKSLSHLHQFNQVFECLLIKAEIGGEINGESYEFSEFYNILKEKGEPTCVPGPNIKNSGSTPTSETTMPDNSSDNYNDQNQPDVMAFGKIFQQLLALVIPTANAQNIYEDNIAPNLPPGANDGVQQITDQFNILTDEQKQSIIDQANSTTGSDQKLNSDQTVFPAPLEFHDPTEIAYLLPTTMEQLKANVKNETTVDDRIYFLLYHIYRTLEKEGEVYDAYIESKVIQDATTPGEVLANCGSLEDDPKSCYKPYTNICGITSAYYFLFKLAMGDIDNLGVPYKDRAHLKIWLGSNAPKYSDEQTEDETVYVPNPHYEFKAVDISEIGLYNESVDCTLCRGLPSCKMFSAITNAYSSLQDAASSATSFTEVPPNNMAQNNLNNLLSQEKAYAQASFNPLSLATGIYTDALICLSLCKITLGAVCIPCCPRVLDTANPETIAVQVKWQNENYGSVLSDIAGQVMDENLPFDPENGFSIENMLKGLAQNALEQLFDSGFKDFDVAKIAQGGFESFMQEMGNQWLDEKVFGKLGLPDGFASGVNWQNPDPESLITSITGGYLDDQMGLDTGSFTPVIAAMMSGNLQNAALSALNLTSNLDLPPALQTALNTAIQNGDKPKAMGLALANIGLKELNTKILGWPDGILDINSFSGEGFIGIANKLGQQGLSKIQGLPTDFIFDISDPTNTAMSLTGSLLSDATDNQKINNAITSAISQGQNFSLNEAMQLMDTENIAQVFDLDNANAQLIKDYLDNPSSAPFVTFRNSIIDKINFDEAAAKNTNFTPESLRTLFDYGLNPAYSDTNSTMGGLMTSALSNSIKLDKIGINLNQTDIEKMAYLQKYIQLSSSLSQSNSNSYGYNPYAFSPEIQSLSLEYANRFGNSESITQFKDRITGTIDQAAINPNSETANAINQAKYLNQPLKIKFTERINKNDLSTIDYIDSINPTNTNTISNPVYSSTNLPSGQFVGVLRSLNIDLNSLEIVHSSVIEQKINSTLSASPTNNLPSNYMSGGTLPIYNNQAANSDYFEPGETYYAYPKIDMAEIILPGIKNQDYHNEIGNFKLLATSTKIIQYSQITPITISTYPGNNPAINNIISQDPFKKAFLDRFEVEYVQPDKTLKQFDTATFAGGSENIYNTLKNIGTANTQQAEDNLSNIGSMIIASSMTGINIANLFSDTQDLSGIEDKISQFANTMGIVKSWQTGDIDSGIKSTTAFLKENGIFDNIAADSAWNIGSDGNITINGFDPLQIYSDLENGNYKNFFTDIPLIQKKNKQIQEALGTDPTQIIDLIQNFSPEKASDTVMDIMASKISSESGLEKLAVVQELTNTLGMPPDPKNIPKLLQSDLIQTKVLSDIDPDLLGDISGIYGLIADGKITPQKAVSTIMTANFFQNAIGKEDFQNFMSDYGGLVNAALSADPKSIANTLLSTPKIADKLNGWLQDKGINEYFDIAGLQSLINGDIKSFVKTTAVKYLQKELLSKLDSALGGLLGDSILSILDGKFPYEALTQFATEYLIKNFLGSGEELLQSIGNGFTDGLTLNPADMGINTVNNAIESAIAGALSGFVFKKCKKQIAQDNITHLSDIIISYPTSPFNHRYYGIEMEDNTPTYNGYKKMQIYFPQQIFTDYPKTILGKLYEKAKQSFDNVWYEKRSSKLNLFQKTCTERKNNFLQKCEDSLHISF